MQFGPPPWTQKTQEHAALAKNVGDWDWTMTWNMPGGMQAKGKGTSTAKMALNGYYLAEDSKGSFNMMGQDIPIVGKLFMGYDTVDKEYFSIWMSASTPVPGISTGKMKDGAITFEGMEADYMNPKGTKKKSKSVLKFDSDDKHTLTFFDSQADGSFKESGVMVFTRKGADAAKAAEGCGCGEKAAE